MSVQAISINSLSAGYKDKKIVENVSFSVNAGQVFGLVGLNGAGKTTLIKTVVALRQKMGGEIDVAGSRKNICYLPERFDPPWFLKGYDFLKFSQALYKKTITFDEAVKAAQSISLDPAALKRYVQTYSKGMRQKLGLLATFLSDCPVLVLDEPMSGLDPQARQEVKNLIKVARENGRTVFMSSHILADVEELCDTVAVFHNRTIIFNGSSSELKSRGQEENLEKAFLNLIKS